MKHLPEPGHLAIDGFGSVLQVQLHSLGMPASSFLQPRSEGVDRYLEHVVGSADLGQIAGLRVVVGRVGDNAGAGGGHHHRAPGRAVARPLPCVGCSVLPQALSRKTRNASRTVARARRGERIEGPSGDEVGEKGDHSGHQDQDGTKRLVQRQHTDETEGVSE
jgi:hypothetical protein